MPVEGVGYLTSLSSKFVKTVIAKKASLKKLYSVKWWVLKLII